MAALERVATRTGIVTVDSVKMCSTTRRHQSCPELSIHNFPHGEGGSGCNNQLAFPWLAHATERAIFTGSISQKTLCAG